MLSIWTSVLKVVNQLNNKFGIWRITVSNGWKKIDLMKGSLSKLGRTFLDLESNIWLKTTILKLDKIWRKKIHWCTKIITRNYHWMGQKVNSEKTCTPIHTCFTFIEGFWIKHKYMNKGWTWAWFLESMPGRLSFLCGTTPHVSMESVIVHML